MPRTTRKQNRGHHLRLTRKTSALSQVGGARWHMIPQERKALWTEVLGTSSPLSFLVDTRKNWALPENFPMKSYGILLQRQDELMAAARQCMMKSANITEATDTKDVVAAVSKVNTSYLDDVLNFIAFSEGTTQASTDSKNTYLKQNVLDCILFPKRVENLLVYAIASIIVNLKRNPSMLGDAATTPKLKDILVRQCKSFYYELAYEQTATEPKDTFHMRQQMSTAKTLFEGSFWNEFISKCLTTPTAPPSKINLSDIAAAVYKNINADSIISAVYSSLNGPSLTPIPQYTAAPDPMLWDGIITDKLKYKDFLTVSYEPKHIEFLFHLAYTVQKILGETAGEAAAASSSNAAAASGSTPAAPSSNAAAASSSNAAASGSTPAAASSSTAASATGSNANTNNGIDK